jgi:hypothetical protein
MPSPSIWHHYYLNQEIFDISSTLFRQDLVLWNCTRIPWIVTVSIVGFGIAIFSVDIGILFSVGLINIIITALINLFPLKVVAVVTIKLVLTVDVA